jgi:hypothetical protein
MVKESNTVSKLSPLLKVKAAKPDEEQATMVSVASYLGCFVIVIPVFPENWTSVAKE